jgi:hypothetical protein
MNCDLRNNNNSTFIKLEMYTANALGQLYVKYCMVNVSVAEFKLSSELKNYEITGHQFIQTPFFVSMTRTHC